MVNDLSDSEKEYPLQPPYGLLFLISSNVFYMHHPTDRIALAGTRNRSMGLI